MAKKFVRGITNVKTINNQDLDTNNVNDLLSDGEHNYIHRKKKDGSQEYHNLTNNLKTIEPEDNGLLTVRNYNNSTNSAKLTVHHDPQKEQKIYSTDHTIEIVHGDNGTGELTNVDVNFEKVQEKITSNGSIGVFGTGLRQLYTQSQTYTHANGILKTHVKSVANSASVSTDEEEFNFLGKMNVGQISAVFTLNAHDRAVFQYLVDTYGTNNVMNVCNTSLSLSGSQLTFGSNGTTYNPHIITFSDIIPTSAINTNP